MMLLMTTVSKAQTLQILNDTNCYKQDSVHLYYKIGMVETDSFLFTEYKYQFTIEKKTKYKIKHLYDLDMNKIFISANESGIDMYFIKTIGIPSFKIIIKLKEISYIVHVENYKFVKIISTV